MGRLNMVQAVITSRLLSYTGIGVFKWGRVGRLIVRAGFVVEAIVAVGGVVYNVILYLVVVSSYYIVVGWFLGTT